MKILEAQSSDGRITLKLEESIELDELCRNITHIYRTASNNPGIMYLSRLGDFLIKPFADSKPRKSFFLVDYKKDPFLFLFSISGYEQEENNEYSIIQQQASDAQRNILFHALEELAQQTNPSSK